MPQKPSLRKPPPMEPVASHAPVKQREPIKFNGAQKAGQSILENIGGIPQALFGGIDINDDSFNVGNGIGMMAGALGPFGKNEAAPLIKYLADQMKRWGMTPAEALSKISMGHNVGDLGDIAQGGQPRTAGQMIKKISGIDRRAPSGMAPLADDVESVMANHALSTEGPGPLGGLDEPWTPAAKRMGPNAPQSVGMKSIWNPGQGPDSRDYSNARDVIGGLAGEFEDLTKIREKGWGKLRTNISPDGASSSEIHGKIKPDEINKAINNKASWAGEPMKPILDNFESGQPPNNELFLKQLQALADSWLKRRQ